MISKLISLSFALLILADDPDAQQKPFSIKGEMEGETGTYIYLTYQNGGKFVHDSSIIENGRFSFKGSLNGPAQATLLMDKNGRGYDKYTSVFIVPADMQLKIVYDKFYEDVQLTGSPVQAEADELKKLKVPVMAQLKQLSVAYNKANTVYSEAIKAKKDEATLASLKEAATAAKNAGEPLREELNKIDDAFMKKYPSSLVTASLLRYAASRLSYSELESRYNQLSAEVKNSSLGKEIKREVDALRMGSPGAKAFVFESKELRGDQLSLADYKGKYVLIDFWASWCVPCRKGNPHLLSLYSKYKNKGFEIIGISDDDSNHEAWKKAVEQDRIGVWKHVLRGHKMSADYQFDPYDILNLYGIHTLPTKILVDPNGIIIGRYGGGGEIDEAMDKKLAEIFGE